MESHPIFRRFSPVLTAAVTVTWALLAVDAAQRSGWEGVSIARHTLAAVVLFTVEGACIGLAVAGTLLAGRWVSKKCERWVPSARTWGEPLLAAVVLTSCTGSTAFWVFSGERIRTTLVGRVGPYALLIAFAILGAGAAVLLRRGLSWLPLVGTRRAFFLATPLVRSFLTIARVDLTVYPALYARLHTILETIAVAVGVIAVASVLVVAYGRHARLAELSFRLSAAACFVFAVFVVVEPLRRWVEESLRHAWREPVYVGRALSRLQIAEGFIRDPRGWRGATMSSVVRLRERYDIATTARNPIWDNPPPEPPAARERALGLRRGRQYNIVVYYVDTLRADIARDAKIMPNLARFSAESLDFRRAYTTGSDTLHALPGMIGGTYDLFAPPTNDLFHLAHRSGYRTALVVAQSAHEFLSKLLPQFRFDATVDVSDYAAGNENVWGYGADQPTGARIVDRGIEWLREGRGASHLLWLFNFDLHNWREIDEAYLRHAGKQYGLLNEADPIWRYRVAARDIDTQFGRFLDGLHDLDADSDTVVLFVSDHGEGLGQEGFWVHSVFLWESLVRVPLVLRAPGVPPKAVDDVVSVVDLVPTLARFMSPTADTSSYHGEDLLGYVATTHEERRLPLVLMGTLKEVPVRLGIVDPRSPYKLVLPLEGAVPELYDLSTPTPDSRDASMEHPRETLRLLNDLVRAPLFPRLSEAGSSGALDQAAVEGRTAIELEARPSK